MKSHVKIFLVAFMIHSGAVAQDKMLLETKYFYIHSNALLNVHLFLYQHAAAIKSLKIPDDSLSFYLSRKGIPDQAGSYMRVIAAMKYYRDSLITKDLLADSGMRKFSVMLVTNKQRMALGWQQQALQHIRIIQPFFDRELWPAIDSSNKAWVENIKNDMVLHQDEMVGRLKKIYASAMPKQKIRIDLAEYASWAGAYSYSEGIDHIIIATNGRLNQGRLGLEIVFHEASHFLVDKVYNLLAQYFAQKKGPAKRRQTWHNMVFYTTGYLLNQIYARQGITFIPYYKEAKFEKRASFKLNIQAFALYWDPYLRGETTMETALKNVVEYIVTNEQ